MAKVSAINKNNRRIKLSEKFRDKRSKLKDEAYYSIRNRIWVSFKHLPLLYLIVHLLNNFSIWHKNCRFTNKTINLKDTEIL